jgi:hypothetical protein
VDVCYADEFCRLEKFQRKEEFWAALNRANEIKEKWENRIVAKRINLVSGNRIMELLGIKPGPIVGEIKRSVEDKIMDELLNPDDEELVDQLIKAIWKEIKI